MTYLTIARISGEPDRLLDGYHQTAAVMSEVGRTHGLIVHAAARTDEGLLIVNLWPSQDRSEAAAGDPRRREVIEAHALDPARLRQEHHDVAAYEVRRPGQTDAGLLEPLRASWAMLLRTRKRDGSLVSTPVNVAVDGDRAYFSTPAHAGKVKRLANFGEVEVTPCTARGRPTGATLRATARKLEGEQAAAARAKLRAKHPFVHRVLVPIELRLRRTGEVVYELSGWRATG